MYFVRNREGAWKDEAACRERRGMNLSFQTHSSSSSLTVVYLADRWFAAAIPPCLVPAGEQFK